MKAFAYDSAHRLDAFNITLRDVPEPQIGPQDILVTVRACAFNPVDCKVRLTRDGAPGVPVILGWDASGVVEAVGDQVSDFLPGDEVFYAGDLRRAGSYAQRQAVDHRLVARKPRSIDFADAAALPLTALTANEALFERGVLYDPGSHVLVIGGAGGVGSIAIQLLKALTPATVIATASRPETIDWVRSMGADQVIGRDIGVDLAALGTPALDVIFSTTHTQDYLPAIPGLLRAFGHLMVIDDPAVLDINPFKPKALSVHWEFMFAKAIHGYRPETQGAFLAELAMLVDAGIIKTSRTLCVAANEDSVKMAHVALEGGLALGKMVMVW